MRNLKQRMIAFLSVILCTFLGILLILSEPAFADVSPVNLPPSFLSKISTGTAYTKNHRLTLKEPAIAEARNVTFLPQGGSPIPLVGGTAYKVYRTKETIEACSDHTAYIEFLFNDDGGNLIFQETYPIQDEWELAFNTPIFTETTPIPNSGNDNGFSTHITEGIVQNVSTCGNLELEENHQLQLLSGFKGKDDAGKESAHFLVAKDYYADTDGDEDYDYLGSLTSIKGEALPSLGGISVAQLIIAPNSIRAPHWHLQWAETGYCYHGLGQVGVITPGNVIPNPDGSGFIQEKRVEEIFVKPHEIFVFPQGSQHYLRNIGTEADGNFACTLFFAHAVPLNEDALLTITLQNLVGSTPLGVLDPILVMDDASMGSEIYSSARLSASPAQTYSSVNQGPDIVEVFECQRGATPDNTADITAGYCKGQSYQN